MPATAPAITRDAMRAALSAREMNRAIHRPLAPSASNIPAMKTEAQPQRVLPAASLRAGHGEQRGLANGVEGKGEQRPHQATPAGSGPGPDAPASAPSGHRAHHLVGLGGKHGAQVEHAQQDQEGDRDPGPENSSHSGADQLPESRLTASAMATTTAPCPSENRPPQKRAIRGRAGRCSASGRRWWPIVVGIETMFHAQHEDQQDKGEVVGRQGRHGPVPDA